MQAPDHPDALTGFIDTSVGPEPCPDCHGTPEHDAAVAARALREAANEVAYAVDWGDAPESVESWLHERADRIETEGETP